MLYTTRARGSGYYFCPFSSQRSLLIFTVLLAKKCHTTPSAMWASYTVVHFMGKSIFSSSIWMTNTWKILMNLYRIAFHVAIGVVTAGKWRLLKFDAPIANIVARDGTWALAMICGELPTAPWDLFFLNWIDSTAIYTIIIHHLMSMEWSRPEYMFV